MEELKIRVRWSGGTFMLSFTKSSTLKDLRDQISAKTQIAPRYQELRKGYPPCVFFLPNITTFESAHIGSGESILVEKLLKPIDINEDTDSMPIIRRIIAADNSCLFNSISYALETRNKKAGVFLRSVISAFIESDSETYNESLLGKNNQEYCSWIENETSWGGGIELSILSKYYSVEIAAVSIQTARIDLFGQEEGHQKRIYVIYDGIHYDVLVKNYSESEDEANDVTVFSVNDENTYIAAIAFAEELRKARQFTDVHSFTLMCAVCSTGLIGEKEAVLHAKNTGHQNFQEFHK